MKLLKNKNIIFVISLSLALLAGCKKEEKLERLGTITDSIDDSVVYIEKPGKTEVAKLDKVESELIHSSMQDYLEDKTVKSKYFDLNVRRMSSKLFFMSLAEDTPYNIIVDPEVKGLVSVNLKNTTIEKALDYTAEIYGYSWKKDGVNIIVSPIRLETKNFPFNYIMMPRTGTSSLSANVGGGSGATTASGSGEVNGTTVIDVWNEVTSNVTAMLSELPGRGVNFSPSSSMITVTATPAELKFIESYLNEAQRVVNKQVVIEAKILEITLDKNTEMGVNWSWNGWKDFGLNALQSSPISSVPAAGAMVATFSGTTIESQTDSSSASIKNDASKDFGSLVKALNTFGSTEILSSPRIATLNNQKAIMKVGEEQYFITELASAVTNTSASGASVQTDSAPKFEPFFTGVALDVTPSIDKENNITLHIHPIITDVSNQTIKVDGKEYTFAKTSVRESDTIVRAKNNQVVVIGGLMYDKAEKQKNGIIAANRTNKKKKIELIILLRPIIVEQQSLNNDLKAVSNRFTDIRKGM